MTMMNDTKIKMNATVFGQVNLDEARLSAELNLIETTFPYNINYSRYARGNPGWKNLVLWNESGDYTDTVFKGSYEGLPQKTELGEKTTYLNELIQNTFELKYMKWARIFWCHEGILIPHRDYLDIDDDDFTRVHVVLQTDTDARHSEEDKCYHMRKGEIWYVDGKYIHCAQSFAKQPRINLVMDFIPGVPFADLFRDASAYNPDIQPHWIERAPFTEADFENLMALSNVVDETNWTDIVAIVAKVHFQKNTSAAFVYDWLIEIANRSGNETLMAQSVEMKSFFIGE